MTSPTDPGTADPDPTTVVRQLFDHTSWQAFDIDDEGRVLARHDGLGSTQGRGRGRRVQNRSGSSCHTGQHV